VSDNGQLVIPGTVTSTGLTLPADLSFEQWQDVCGQIGMATKACLWWWGDALNYGEAKWGEMYAQALDESDYQYQTLANAKWVAKAIPFSCRHEKLSFEHHYQVAGLPAEQRDELLDKAEADKQTRDELRRAVRRLRKTGEPAALPASGYRVIYADPPWQYGDTLLNMPGAGAEDHYPSMSIDELCAMRVEDLATSDAVLFMWVTSPLLEECFPIIRAWGFEYKTSFVWDKVKHNMGHYNSVRHELLLVCTRGSCTPDVPTLIDSVQSIERSGRHSEKPQEFRTIIDTLYPTGKRLELFARAPVDGWDVWGNEVAA
jgi:N6-adenosine-specific RNA methylase IME4